MVGESDILKHGGKNYGLYISYIYYIAINSTITFHILDIYSGKKKY